MAQADAAHTTNRAITVSDLSAMSGEPRVEDLVLAGVLGMKNLHDIRTLIRRHIEDLRRFGEVFATWRKPGPQGGRPGTEYHLNKKQALYITAKSDTPRAADVTVAMVEVFDAFMSGNKVPVRCHLRAKPDRLPALPAIDRDGLVPPAKIGAAAAPAPPFGSDVAMLRDLQAAVMSANVRVERGEDLDFGRALEGVLGDRLQQREGGPLSGKALLDWNWRRTDAAKAKRTCARGHDARPAIATGR